MGEVYGAYKLTVNRVLPPHRERLVIPSRGSIPMTPCQYSSRYWVVVGLHHVGESSIRYSFEEPLLYDSSPTNLKYLISPRSGMIFVNGGQNIGDVLMRWVSFENGFSNK